MTQYLWILLLWANQQFSVLDGPNTFLQWTQSRVETRNKSSCWICGLLPISSPLDLPWWVSPLQGKDWKRVQRFIDEMRNMSSAISGSKVVKCSATEGPGALPPESKGDQDKPFSFFQPKLEKERASRGMGNRKPLPLIWLRNSGYTRKGAYQVWDEYIWAAPLLGALGRQRLRCWELSKRQFSRRPRGAKKKKGKRPRPACKHIMVLKSADWFVTD